MNSPIAEWQIDLINENKSHNCEAMIDHSQLEFEENEEQTRQLEQSMEVYFQGVKDEIRGTVDSSC